MHSPLLAIFFQKSIQPNVSHIQLGLPLFFFMLNLTSPLENISEYSTDSNCTILASMLSSVVCMWFVCGLGCTAS